MTPIADTFADVPYLLDASALADAPSALWRALAACAACAALAVVVAALLPAGRRWWALGPVPALAVLGVGLVRVALEPVPLDSAALAPWLAAGTWAETVGAAAGVGFAALVGIGVAVPSRRSRLLVVLLALVGVAASVFGVVDRHRRTAAFVGAVEAALPLPVVDPREAPIAMHVGGHRTVAVAADAAGQGRGFLGGLPVPLAAEDRDGWGLSSVDLSVTGPGPATVTVPARRGPLSVAVAVPVVGIEDRGPEVLPLEPGARWRYRRIERDRRSSIELEVTAERWDDGFHVFTLTRTDEGAAPVTFDVVRLDGALRYHPIADGPVPIALYDQRRCAGALFGEWYACDCSSGRITDCAAGSVPGDDRLVRMLSAVVTAGLSELVAGDRADPGPLRRVVLVDPPSDRRDPD